MQRTNDLVQDSLTYLSSLAAATSLATDPYWPKWDSPWWHLTLLYEMGRAAEIPGTVIRNFLATFRRHYLDFFPFTEAEIPPGKDPIRHIACHCALGTVFKIAAACGLDPDEELPWARAWFLKYQLPDGGWNCDEAVYLKDHPKSSIVSTLPVLEAILEGTRRPFTAAETALLEAGAAYLLEHRLFRRKTAPHDLINPAWLQLCFPRFYDYDHLRGLAFLARLQARVAGDGLPGFRFSQTPEHIAEAVELLQSAIDPQTGHPQLGRQAWAGAKTRAPQGDGTWTSGNPATSFPLLEMVSLPHTPCSYLLPDLEAVRQAFLGAHK
jgi:hypothetical protein